MAEIKKNIIIFTGQSGVKVSECFKRLNFPQIENLKTICLEDRLSEEYKRGFKKFLYEDVQFQNELWTKVFEEVINEILEKYNDNLVFLSLHGSYYHHNSTEFVSAINFETILRLKGRVMKVITLIDDIYDIYKQLTVAGEIFGNIMNEIYSYRAISKSIQNLILILDWRHNEIVISHLLANSLDVQFYVVAIKHPVSIIRRLIDSDEKSLKIFYLAHPISVIRSESDKVMSKFPAQLNAFGENIVNINQKAVLFFPSTIDELRIEKKSFKIEDNTIERYVPELLSRLTNPFDEDEQIGLGLPPSLKNLDPFNPSGVDASNLTENEKNSIGTQLDYLREKIRLQVTSRDYKLVDQSKNGIIAYRPYYKESLSGGVWNEIKYNHKLAQRNEERDCLIISIKKDHAKTRIFNFFTYLIGNIVGLSDEQKKLLKDECDNWEKSAEKIGLFSDNDYISNNMQDILESVENVNNLLPKVYKFQNELIIKKKGTFLEGVFKSEDETREEVLEAIKSTLLSDKLNSKVKVENYQKFEDPNDLKIQKMLKKYISNSI
ncbi:hypothetical protein LCGC14_0814500 [marine sediment metagenome]|uniref:Uncharacterized protein n=1 Tax=marine sediment metagenome TaxID=412755 RepID=A0A0F9Q5Z2_9ZZZZ